MTKFQGNSVDEAVDKGLKALGLVRDQVTVTVLDEGKKGFLGIGKKEAEVELTPVIVSHEDEVEVEVIEETLSVDGSSVPQENKVTILEHLEEEEALKELALYLTDMTKEMNAPALVKIKREGSHIILQLDAEKQGMLIGKHGKVLNALQYLAQVFIHRVAKNKLSVVVNVGDYREKRKVILENLAKRTADKVHQTGQPVFLEPMPAFERKQIHAVLTDNPYVKTHSEGDEPYRYLVVEPEKHLF